MNFLRKSYKVMEGGTFLGFLDKAHLMIILLLKYNLLNSSQVQILKVSTKTQF